jgi:hypothetical protein
LKTGRHSLDLRAGRDDPIPASLFPDSRNPIRDQKQAGILPVDPATFLSPF